MGIKTLISYFQSIFLLNKIEKISKLNIHNIEIQRIELKPKIFLTPGKYSIVYLNKFNNKTICRFKVEEICHLTIKEVFELSNIL